MTLVTPIQNADSRRIPALWRLFGLSLLMAGLSFSAISLNSAAGGINVLWPSNGLMVGVLLRSSRRQWPAYVAMAFLVDVGTNFYLSNPSLIATYLGVCNIVEILLAAGLLYRTIAPDPDLTRRRQLTEFLIYGVVVAPAVASFLASFALQGLNYNSLFHSFRLWFTADVLGMSTMVPLCLAFVRKERLFGRSLSEVAGLLLLLSVTIVLTFWQSRYPLAILVLIILQLVGIRLGLAASAIGLLLLSVIGGYFTIIGRGPLALIPGTTLGDRIVMLQAFLAIAMLVLYVVEVIRADGRRLQQSLKSSEARFRLLAETSRDIIMLTDLDAVQSYVSPAVAEVLGWLPGELIGGSYREIIHPHDRAQLENLLDVCRVGVLPDIVTYRCIRKDGTYLWMEANLRLFRNSVTNEPIGFVNVLRDISQRKANEDQLNRALQQLENQASMDGLTGIANRRRLDEILDSEWHRAMRDVACISLLLMDVDNFKRYNDLYGHIDGDQCLREIAVTLREVVRRPADLTARFGGEEFVVVMPNTDSVGAQAIAEQIRSSVELLGIPHSANVRSVITVSIGCATLIPEPDSSVSSLLQAADRALYQAKSAGRNRVRVASQVPA